MQVLSPKPSTTMEERRGSSQLCRSRSLPANYRDLTASQACAAKGLFSATKCTGPSALLERRKQVNPALKVEAFNSSSEPSSLPPPPPPPPPAAAAAAAAGQPRSPYDVLQVSPLASQEDIKTAYWRSALKHHPDKVPSHQKEASTLAFLEIQSAYSILKDPISRARFDLQMSLQSFQSSGYHCRSAAASPSSSTPRPHPTTYPYTPRAHPTRTTFSPNFYTPRAPASSPNYFTPRSPYSIGRNWETDQCV